MTAETDSLPAGALAAAAILERIDEAVCALGRDRTITYANPASAGIFGRPREELTGRRIEDVLPGFDEELREALDGALRDGGTRRSDRAGGSVEITIHPTPDGVWVRFRDVHARQAMEQLLRERDDILTMAERSAGIGVWDVDLATGMLRGTRQFWRIMGLPEIDHAVSIEITRALRLPDDRERVAQGFQEVVGNHAESFESEYRIRRPADGEIRWIFGRGRLIRDAAGKAVRYSGIDMDVTERKLAETILADMNRVLEQRVTERTAELEAEIARRAEAEARLHQAQKMETIGQLPGGIAHDFNNLLTVISGNVEALERRLRGDDGSLRRFAEAALRGTERAATLTGRLLAFARRQTLEPTLVDVNQLVLGMSDLLHRTLGERISVRLSLAEDLPAVLADHNQLESAILNLAVNSHDAMPDGGTLAIETAAAGDAERETEPGQAATFVRITVSDTGVGMAPDVRDMAFEPFFTTKQPGQGTGLGLSQVYGFIKQSGGYCQLDSEPGAGTRVNLYLPRTAHSEPAQPVGAAPTGLPRGSGETILVTEDDTEVRAYSAELLRELGYRVLTAADATQALQVLAHEAAVLLFTDLGLPGELNGRQLAEAATARYPGLKVLLTTGYASDAIARNGWRDPAMELIAKPFTSAALAAKIRQVLGG
jgi:PAS domain S-box-containing protein